MPSREEIVHEISSIANWCEDQAASSALEDLARQSGNMRCEGCDSKDELLKEMADRLNNCLVMLEDYSGTNADMRTIEKSKIALQKYHGQTGELK